MHVVIMNSYHVMVNSVSELLLYSCKLTIVKSSHIAIAMHIPTDKS